MLKKFLILIFLLISLLTLLLLLIPERKEKDIDIKGDTTTKCIEIENRAEEILYNFSLKREWYVKSPEVLEKEITLELNLPLEMVEVTYTLNDESHLAVYTEDKWLINIPIDSLESNNYELTIYCNICESNISKTLSFKVSNPVYVTWSIDWEGLDVKDQYLKDMERVSSSYNVPMTHFFNPYIYIYLSPSRAKYLTDWVKRRENESIGLHLHMYNRLVEASGVVVNNTPAWGSPMGNGHDTPNSNYGYDDFKKILEWSINQYEKNGLEKPTMYRAGGWFIDEENINVLKNLGFRIESSGRTYYKHGSNLLEGHWTLKETTQPYQMNSVNQNVTNKPNINIWEYPNNGGDSWAYNSQKLTSRFKANYAGGISKTDTVVTYLSHPHWFDKEGPNIEGTFKYISKYTYSSDSGPVIFLTLDKVHQYTVKQ